MLDWWRPLKLKKENVDDFWFDKESTMFDMYKTQDNELCPLIIGCSNDEYYLVATRYAQCINRFNGKYKLLKPNENEVLIKMTKTGFMGYSFYYVDCGRIFVINCDDLNTIVKNDTFWDDYYERIWDHSIYNIIDKIKENIFEKEPMFSILFIGLNNNEIYYYTHFLNKKMLDKIVKRIGDSKVIANKYDAMDLNYHSLVGMDEYTSKFRIVPGWKKEKNEHEISFSYQQAINFCKYFLNEYCNWETDKFLKNQKINNKENGE